MDGCSFEVCHQFKLRKDVVNDIVGAANIVTWLPRLFCDEVISHSGSSLPAFRSATATLNCETRKIRPFESIFMYLEPG